MELEECLISLGIRPKLIGTKNFVFRCPYPDHDERTPSFNIKVEYPYVFQCFGCHRTGTIIRLIQDIKKFNPLQAFAYAERYGYQEILIPEDEAPAEVLKVVPEERLNAFRPIKGYRELNEATCKEWGLCYDPELERVVFPIRNEVGQLLGMTGRTVSTPENRIKYLVYDEFSKGKALYGCHKVDSSKPVIVVEGNYDVCRLWELGIKNAVATMGTIMTEEQERMLKMLASEVYLAFDADEAGRKGTEKAVEKLRGALNINVLTYPVKLKDAGDLRSVEEWKWMLENKQPAL